MKGVIIKYAPIILSNLHTSQDPVGSNQDPESSMSKDGSIFALFSTVLLNPFFFSFLMEGEKQRQMEKTVALRLDYIMSLISISPEGEK